MKQACDLLLIIPAVRGTLTIVMIGLNEAVFQLIVGGFTNSPAVQNRYNPYNRSSLETTELDAGREQVPGFLGTRGSFTLDLVFVAMFLVVPVMWSSVWLVHTGQRFRLHKAIQITLAIVLLIAVMVFELEIRLRGWRHLAAESPFWHDGGWNDWIDYSLVVHLLFAIPTPLIWTVVIVRALRGFPRPPQPSNHSQAHRLWGKIAAAGMTLTAVTGCIFYWLAFAAK